MQPVEGEARLTTSDPILRKIMKIWHSFTQALGFSCASTTRTPVRSALARIHNSVIDQSFLPGMLQINSLVQTNNNTMPQLLEILADGSFFEKTNGEWKLDFKQDILAIIKNDFKHELPRLKRARADWSGIPEQRPNSFGVLLYGKEDGEPEAMTYYELDRTLTAVQALRWIKDGNKQAFNTKLRQDSWEWIIARFNEENARVFEKEYAEECLALITSVIINDLGKDPELAKDYKKYRPDEDITTDNHDMQLDKAIKAGMVPSLEWLRPDLKSDILLGIHVGAECNLGQLAQAENVPASLYPLTRFRQSKRAWRFRFMEQLLDLAGARGHFDNTHATVFNEAVAQGNRIAHAVAENIIWNRVSPVAGYNTSLTERYTMIQAAGYETVLDIYDPRHRALMRLFCMGGVHDSSTAHLYESALLFSPSITTPIRNFLITSLNNDGLSYPAIQITYSPAMLSGALSHHPWPTPSAKITALAAVLCYMAKVYRATEAEVEQWQSQGITVVQRDVFEVVAEYVKTESFKEDPMGLLGVEVPWWAVTNWVEGGFEGDYRGYGDARGWGWDGCIGRV